MSSFLDTPIEYLNGIGPQRGTVLRKELRILTYRDLLFYFPFRYIDRTDFHKIVDIPGIEGYVQLKGKIFGIREIGTGKGKRLAATFRDDTGTIELVWFKSAGWIKKTLKSDVSYKLYGKPKQFGFKYSISHPELEEIDISKPDQIGLQSVYHSSDKLTRSFLHSKGLEKAIKILLPFIENKIDENLPDWIVRDLNLMAKEKSLIAIHSPKNFKEAKEAQLRIKFEELFFLQLELLIRKQISQKKIKGYQFDVVG